MSREAMQLALEALEEFCEHQTMLRPIEKRDALRQALVDADDTSQKRVDEKAKREHEWVGLTDEERSYYLQSASNVGWWQAAKMIESKLKEKNA